MLFATSKLVIYFFIQVYKIYFRSKKSCVFSKKNITIPLYLSKNQHRTYQP